jgi:hypothetical protein
MTIKPANGLGINMTCLERMIRFVERQMATDEVITFAAHFQDCFDCRDFAHDVRELLDWRESVRIRLNQEEVRQER